MDNEGALFHQIREKRDRLRLQAHLGTIEVRSLWETLDKKWKELIDRTSAPGELQTFERELACELKKGYEKLEAAMKNIRHQVSEPCLERKDVEQLAYELWDRRGRPVGTPDEDWLRAENILSGKNAEEALPALVGNGLEADGFPETNWN
jgi:hypothetical protein